MKGNLFNNLCEVLCKFQAIISSYQTSPQISWGILQDYTVHEIPEAS